MLIMNLTHIHMYLSLKKFIVISIIICPVNNNSYINFFLIFFFQTNSWLLVDLIIKVELKMVIISSNVIS